MKNGGRLGAIVRHILPVCLFALVFSFFSSVAYAEEKRLELDKETLKQQLTDLAIEKLFGDLHKVPEDKLKDATYFNEILRGMEPLGVKLDETNFTDTALGIYNEYKEAVDSGITPEEASQNVRDMFKGKVKSLVFQSLDKGSQEVLTDLQGLVDNAQKELNAILGLNKELEENPSADYAKLLKKYGVKGEMLDKFEKVEGKLRGIVNSDYVKAGKIIYDGMSGSPGDKIEALFSLGAEFGGKIPVLGRFVELYFKVAQEMLKATGRLGRLLENRQAGCLGVGTVGISETVKSVQNERNVSFSKTYKGVTVCPVERTKDFYRDIYEDIEKPGQIYFWNGSGFAKGNLKSGGINSLKALRVFLRSEGEVAKASDMQFMIRAYNLSPGFLDRQKKYEEMIKEIRDLISKFREALYCYGPAESNDFLKEKGGLERVIDLSDGIVGDNPDSRIFLWKEGMVKKILKDYYLKDEAKFGRACQIAQEKLRDIVLARIEGQVFIKKEGVTGYASSGVEIIAEPTDNIVEKCSRFSTDSEGLFEILVLKDKGESFSLSVQAKDGDEESDEVSVSISGSKDKYTVKLSLDGACEEGQEMKDGKCVPICGEDEELNKDQTKCLPICKENAERDDSDNCVCMEGYETVNNECVEKCEPNEKRNDKGECEGICPEGQKVNDSGDCEDICKPNEKYIDGECEAVCKEGFKVEADGSCTKICGEGGELNEEGDCVCKKGFEEVDGKCVKACGLNAERDEAGECACKDGFEDVNGVCAPVCKPNEKRNDDGKCIDVCGPNARYLVAEDACECNEGFEPVNNDCVPECKAGEERNAKGECVPPCKPNEKRNDEGNCVDVCGPNARYVAAEDVCECKEGFDAVNEECVPECKKGEIRDANGNCVSPCKANEKLNAEGECIQICGPNATYIADRDVCECNAGFDVFNNECVPVCKEDEIRAADGKCVAACGEDEIRGADGSCTCKAGYVRDENGVCELIETDKCASDADCSTGYECDTSSGECVFAELPGCEETGCPDGYECDRGSGECVYKEPPGCKSDSDCPTDYVCNASTGDCIYQEPGCKSDSDCPTDYVCNGTGDCIYQEPGCRSDNDCPVGYVCSGNGDCISPFESNDPNSTGYIGLLGGKDDQRSQQNIDRSTTDQRNGGRRGGGFTSEEVEGEIGEIAENLGCRSDSDCLDGYRCVNGRCKKEKTSPIKPPEGTPSPPTPEATPTPPTPEATPPPVETASTTGIGVEEVGTAPEGQTLIVSGQLVPVEGWPVNIAGMTLALTGPVNKSTSSSGSGTFNFSLIPAGEYVISVAQWDYGMTKQAFTAPSGKSIKITLKGSCPYLYVWNGDGYEKENDIYSVARIFPSELLADKDRLFADRDGLFLQQVSMENMSQELISQRSYRDYYRVNSHFTVDSDGYYRAKVREQAWERSLSDQFELWAVDHRPGLQVGVTRNGRLFSYKEILPLADQVEAGGAILFNKDVLEVALPADAFGKGVLTIDWQGFQKGDGRGKSASSGRPKLSLQRMGPDGSWQTVDYVYPRDEVQQSLFILDDMGDGWDKDNTVRLVGTSCHSEKFHRIDAVGWARFLSETPTAAHLPLASAVTSRGDDVRLKALEAEGDSIFLGPDEEVFLKFKSNPMTDGMERSFIFVSQGVYIPMPMILLGEVQ